MSSLIGFARAYDVQNYFVASRDLHWHRNIYLCSYK